MYIIIILLIIITTELGGIFFRIKRMESKMSQEIEALCTEIDTATNAIAVVIQKLVDKLHVKPTVDPADITALEAEIAKLNAMGVDPTDPIPTV